MRSQSRHLTIAQHHDTSDFNLGEIVRLLFVCMMKMIMLVDGDNDDDDD